MTTRAPALLLALALLVPLHAAAAETSAAPAVYAAWRAIRQLDCARCHGRDYTGSVGGSLLESARTRSRDEFVRLVLDGNPTRGMPPYRSITLAVENADGMYAYFRGRADGTVPAGTLVRE
ncbi:MAG TPA: cytochrome c [Burkholderiales bacterium]|nr:cytochrome c [Burkholderiales bacterium]